MINVQETFGTENGQCIDQKTGKYKSEKSLSLWKLNVRRDSDVEKKCMQCDNNVCVQEKDEKIKDPKKIKMKSL